MLSLSLQKQNNLEHCVTKQNKKKGQGQPQTTLNHRLSLFQECSYHQINLKIEK